VQGGGTGIPTHGSEPSALSHHLHVLRRGAWIVLLVTAVATAAAYFVSQRQEKLYQASADVFLGTQNLGATLENVAQPYVDPARASQTQAEIARVPAVAQRALAAAGVTNRTPTALLDESSVSASPDSDLLTFTVTDREPDIAIRLASAYARAYTNYRHQLDTASLVSARREVEKRLEELKATGAERSAPYANLLDKDQQLRTMELLQGSNVLLSRAATAADQVQPKPTRNAILAGVLGLALGVGLAFLRDVLNTRVRTGGEVESRLGLPLLGRIPEPTRRLRMREKLVMLADPHTSAAEAFRVLATNVDFVNHDRGAKTIMVTSARRDEGKSTTIANLAIAFARAGRRVALVDLDLRRPTIAAFFGLNGRPGLTEVALGYTELDEAVAKVPVVDESELSLRAGNGSVRGMLDVLPSGPLPPNPPEFLSQAGVSQVLAQVGERADLVLIDATPLLDLSDAMALAARVDAVLVVTRMDNLRRSVLDEMTRVLSSVPVVKLGFVLTGTKADGGYGYGGYGYGYDYGYGEPVRGRKEIDRVR
jgi:capsular exopolysaccharide synthesis family protein